MSALAIAHEKLGDNIKTVIDWNKAPPDATHYILGKNKFANSDFVIEESDRYTGTSRGISHWLKSQLVDQEDFEIIKRPVQLTLIYTQEMDNNGVLPSVGMQCLILFSSSNYSGAITYMGDGVGCFKELNGKEYTFALNSVIFKPLTPPIKLIDGECYQFTSPSGTIRKGYYIPVKNMFICATGNIDTSAATNIQPLTVEKKL
jgi:hypothetical protein